MVVQLTIKYAPAASRNYLPAQIFLVGTGGIVVSGEALASLIAAWLLTLAVRQFVFSLHKEYRFTEVFHAGFYLGLIPLLYAPAAVLTLPVAVAALSIYRRGVREAIVCLAGLVLPVLAAGFIHWWAGQPLWFVFSELWRCIVDRPGTMAGLPPYSAVAVAVLVLMLTLVAIFWVPGHKKSVRKTQYKFIAHTSLVLLFVLATAAIPGTSTTLAALVAVPCALCVPYAFPGKLATISTVIYCLVVAAVLALDLLPVLGIPVP